MDEPTAWPSDWLRGTLSYAVLGSLRLGAMHGYAISSALEVRGLGRIKGGTLYPVLNRLADSGLVASAWEPGSGGPGRKVFSLTTEGLEHLERGEKLWRAFTELIAESIAGPPAQMAPEQPTRSSSSSSRSEISA